MFITKDSGKRVDFPSGMSRDVATNKPRYDLIPISFLERLAGLYQRGAEKYGDENWKLADSEEELARFKASGWRHFIQYMRGDEDEDHMAAVCWNLIALEYLKNKIYGDKNSEIEEDY